MNANRDKQRAFKAKQRAEGLVQVTEWIPAQDRDQFKRIASLMRAGKQATSNVEQVTSTKRPTGRYTAPERQLALSLKAKGVPNTRIIAALQERYGRAPGLNNMKRDLATWAKQLERERELLDVVSRIDPEH